MTHRGDDRLAREKILCEGVIGHDFVFVGGLGDARSTWRVVGRPLRVAQVHAIHLDLRMTCRQSRIRPARRPTMRPCVCTTGPVFLSTVVQSSSSYCSGYGADLLGRSRRGRRFSHVSDSMIRVRGRY